MNTPTHLLVAAALLARPGRKAANRGALAGAMAPDISLYLLVAFAAAEGYSFQTIFDELYFSPSWQTVFAVDNSAPLYALLLGLGLWLRFPVLWAFAAGALLHIALDLPLHHDDGRPHFWPFSNWVFESPVSYWDTAHFGDVVGPIETVFALGLCAVLWFRFEAWPARAAIGIAAALLLVSIVMWLFLLG